MESFYKTLVAEQQHKIDKLLYAFGFFMRNTKCNIAKNATKAHGILDKIENSDFSDMCSYLDDLDDLDDYADFE